MIEGSKYYANSNRLGRFYNTWSQYGAFCGCSNLEFVSFTDGSQLMEIGKDAFYGCTNFIIKLPEGLASIGKEWFKENGIKEVHIPASVQTIGEGAF